MYIYMYIPADYKKTLLQRVCFNLFFDEQELEIELNEAESLLARPDQGVHRHVAHQDRQESGRITAARGHDAERAGQGEEGVAREPAAGAHGLNPKGSQPVRVPSFIFFIFFTLSFSFL